jgi:hypothetical protein
LGIPARIPANGETFLPKAYFEAAADFGGEGSAAQSPIAGVKAREPVSL